MSINGSAYSEVQEDPWKARAMCASYSNIGTNGDGKFRFRKNFATNSIDSNIYVESER